MLFNNLGLRASRLVDGWRHGLVYATRAMALNISQKELQELEYHGEKLAREVSSMFRLMTHIKLETSFAGVERVQGYSQIVLRVRFQSPSYFDSARAAIESHCSSKLPKKVKTRFICTYI